MSDDTKPDLVVDLAFEYCEHRRKHGGNPNYDQFTAALTTQEQLDEFHELINADLLLSLALQGGLPPTSDGPDELDEPDDDEEGPEFGGSSFEGPKPPGF